MASVKRGGILRIYQQRCVPGDLREGGRVDVIVGVPHAIASNGGRPNPSNSDGYTNNSAARYHQGSSSAGTKPGKITASPSPARPHAAKIVS